MYRCLVILIHALLLICAALPAASQALGGMDKTGAMIGTQQDMLLAAADAVEQDGEAGDEGLNPAGDDTLEAPELFARWLLQGLPHPSAVRPAGPCGAHVPTPYLKGPQRPPKAGR